VAGEADQLRGTAVDVERTRVIWANVALCVCVVLTILTGLVVGYGVVWFQIGGSTPDAADYQLSAGGYAAAAALLAVALPALVAYRSARWLVLGASWFAALYLVLAVRSTVLAAEVDDPGPGINTTLDGVGGVVGMPWSWVLVVLGLSGLVRLARRPATRRWLPAGFRTRAR
jgi:hypothetical protein